MNIVEQLGDTRRRVPHVHSSVRTFLLCPDWDHVRRDSVSSGPDSSDSLKHCRPLRSNVNPTDVRVWHGASVVLTALGSSTKVSSVCIFVNAMVERVFTTTHFPQQQAALKPEHLENYALASNSSRNGSDSGCLYRGVLRSNGCSCSIGASGTSNADVSTAQAELVSSGVLMTLTTTLASESASLPALPKIRLTHEARRGTSTDPIY